ncbi:putative lactoylglutathione lyase [Litorimonas taeanensis]|uniref:Putative lactoylglutathione lyase n=1 Tax=Litorimonas taeanensis TaxID=568099 RepID=A0A420WCZ5_9PROT|nr:VOC family protein [Litorimonas taeanensis]RKQ68856.1 putative lactoylglutathione lyase [Litorimonas taeanensis]
MIGYTTLGVKDMEAAKAFYCALFEAKVLVDIGRLAMIGKSTEQPMIAVCIPHNEQEPHPGNGVMVAFPGGSKEGAASLYNKAIALGATCDGEPGPRIEGQFYGAYVKDPEGNKLCFFDFS